MLIFPWKSWFLIAFYGIFPQCRFNNSSKGSVKTRNTLEIMFSSSAKISWKRWKHGSALCIIDYFTDFPYIFDLLGKSVKYVTTICGSIIYWFSLHIFLRNVGKVSKIVPNVCLILILLIFPTFLQHHQFRVTRKVGKISKLCNHI